MSSFLKKAQKAAGYIPVVAAAKKIAQTVQKAKEDDEDEDDEETKLKMEEDAAAAAIIERELEGKPLVPAPIPSGRTAHAVRLASVSLVNAPTLSQLPILAKDDGWKGPPRHFPP